MKIFLKVIVLLLAFGISNGFSATTDHTENPKHDLELSVDNPDALLNDIRHAGAIFMGRHTPEAIGDYCAGPNHVLPTSGTARFSSPLGVYDFQKKSSIIYCSESGSKPLAETADILAQREDLEAHARSARYRYQ